jgi:hypothetical protein
MVAAGERGCVIEAESDGRVGEPGPSAVGEEVLRGLDRQRRLPDQDADVDVRPRRGQVQEDMADLVGLIAALEAIRQQARARIEPPAKQEH